MPGSLALCCCAVLVLRFRITRKWRHVVLLSRQRDAPALLWHRHSQTSCFAHQAGSRCTVTVFGRAAAVTVPSWWKGTGGTASLYHRHALFCGIHGVTPPSSCSVHWYNV